jgi:hypothetical protein
VEPLAQAFLFAENELIMRLRQVHHQYIYTSERLLREVYQQAQSHPQGGIRLTGATLATPVGTLSAGVGPRPDHPDNVFWLAEFAQGVLKEQTCSLPALDDQIRAASSNPEGFHLGAQTQDRHLGTTLEPTGLYLRATLELTWHWLPVVNIPDGVAWMYAIHDDPDTERRTLVGLCGSIKNYRGSIPGSSDPVPGDPWYPSSLMGLRRIFAARAEEEAVKDIEGHEAADGSVFLATRLTSLHRRYIIGAGWVEVLAEVLVQTELPFKIDGYDAIVLGAPLWVRTAPPPLGSDGNSITKPKPVDKEPLPTQSPLGDRPRLPYQPEARSVAMARPIGVAGATLAGIGGLLMIFGSFLPWLVAVRLARGPVSTKALQGDNRSLILVLAWQPCLVPSLDSSGNARQS